MNNSNFTKFLEEICDDNNNNSDDVCLITGTPLEENYIKLFCGHKFNYKPLYQEIVCQKVNPNHLEITKLKTKQMKCPYCRKIQNHLLPPRETFNTVHGVNSPLRFCMKPYICKDIFKSGKRKGQICGRPCRTKFCSYHKKYNETLIKKEKKQCCFILTRGKNKGKLCSRTAKNGCEYCTQHLKIINKDPLINIENVAKKILVKKKKIMKLCNNIIDLTNENIVIKNIENNKITI